MESSRSVERIIRMNTPTIETERLRLRRFEERDLPALEAILADREANVFLPWFPIEGPEQVRAFYEERYASRYDRPWSCDYAVCLREDDVPFGYVKVGADEPHDLGYGLRHDMWNRGYASEATAAVLELAACDGLPYVTATHDRDNPRSGAVMQRLGMTYRYSYEERWQPKDLLVTFRMYQIDLVDPAPPTWRGYWDASEVRFVEPGL